MKLTPITNPVALRLDTSVGTRVFAGDTMIHGDTGWRDITADITNGWRAGSLKIRRQGDVVDFRVSGLDARDALGNTFLYMNTGFAPGAKEKLSLFIKHIAAHGPGDQMSIGDTTGTLNQVFRSSLISRFSLGAFSITYLTSEMWPTTLPGLPA